MATRYKIGSKEAIGGCGDQIESTTLDASRGLTPVLWGDLELRRQRSHCTPHDKEGAASQGRACSLVDLYQTSKSHTASKNCPCCMYTL